MNTSAQITEVAAAKNLGSILTDLRKNGKITAEAFTAWIAGKTPESAAAEILAAALAKHSACGLAANGIMASPAHYVESAIIELIG